MDESGDEAIPPVGDQIWERRVGPFCLTDVRNRALVCGGSYT